MIIGLKKHEKINKLKIEENDELRDEIRKFRESNIKLGRLPKLLEDIRKRDDKSRTFAPPHKKIISDEKLQEIFKDMNKYEDIDLNGVNNLISTINDEITEGDNIVDIGDGKKIYFRDLTDFLYDIKDGKINNFNKEREYEKRL